MLYDRINARVDQMLASGFIDEVRRLDAQGHAAALMRLRSLGYREFLAFIHGHQTLEHATDRMKQLTRNFAKRQLTWFRADKRVRWMGMKETVDPAGLAAKLIEHVQAG